MAEPVKTTYLAKRMKGFKDFYGRMTEDFINKRRLSKTEAADLTLTNINAALDRHQDNVNNLAVRQSYARQLGLEEQSVLDPLGLVRQRAFADVLGEEFSTRMEFALADEQAARAANSVVLQNFVEYTSRPSDGSALLANAALDARAARDNPDVYKQSQGELQRTVGIFPKENNQASLVIRTFKASSEGSEEKLLVIDKFLLTQVSEPSAEKYQIYQTFDQDFIFFFDRNPHIYVYSGVLINADGDFQWRNDFQQEYEANLRGTRCVENNARAILSFEDVTREGYLLDLNLQNVSNNPHHTPFSFTFFVTKEACTRQRPSSVPNLDELSRSGT